MFSQCGRLSKMALEEGFMLVFPERFLEGDLPNRDFLHLYGPGSVWALAGVFKVFGVSLWSERAVALLQQGGLLDLVPKRCWIVSVMPEPWPAA